MALLFATKKNAQNGFHWLVVSDLMAGLMMVFLYVSITFMYQLQNTKQAPNVQENINVELIETKSQSSLIYDALVDEFAQDLNAWNAQIDRDSLSINFLSPELLFNNSATDPSSRFRRILSDFFPRYLAVLEPFKDKLKEVRIEGHTSTPWNKKTAKKEAYFKNMRLSQVRAREVLQYIYSISPEIEWVKNHVVAIGLSSSQAVFVNGVEDTNLSRRVSFRAMPQERRDIDAMIAEAKNETNN